MFPCMNISNTFHRATPRRDYDEWVYSLLLVITAPASPLLSLTFSTTLLFFHLPIYFSHFSARLVVLNFFFFFVTLDMHACIHIIIYIYIM